MKRHRLRGGAIVIIVSQAAVALVFLALGVLYIGRWVNQKEEAGNQADALSLAAMEIARKQGITDVRQLCAHPAMQRLLRDLNGNHGAQFRGDCGRFVEIRNANGTTTLQFVVETRSTLETGPLIDRFMGGVQFDMPANARAALTQENFEDAEIKRFKLVLVLDYSGSMKCNINGDNNDCNVAARSRIVALRRAVNGLLDRNLKIDLGMVMFSSDLIDSVAIGPNSSNRIRNAIRFAADGSTNYGAALNAAQGLFDAVDDFGENVLFISDGAPSDGTADPIPIVHRMWDRGIAFFTLNIGGGGAQAELLRDMSGSSEHPQDPESYFEARNEQQLLAIFDRIARELLCSVGPIQGNIDRPEELLRVFLRLPNGSLEALPRLEDVDSNDWDTIPAYGYDAVERKINLDQAACDRVSDQNNEVVIRYGQTTLVGNP